MNTSPAPWAQDVDVTGDNYLVVDEFGAEVARVCRYRACAWDNVLLITSAPSLLATLKLALEVLGPESDDSTVCVIKDAIAKAQGMARWEPELPAKRQVAE